MPCPSDSQDDRHGSEEHSGGCVLLSVVDLLPVGEPPGISLVPRGVGGALQVVEHDVHPLGGGGRWWGGIFDTMTTTPEPAGKVAEHVVAHMAWETNRTLPSGL